jgi:hypothetical protein
MKKFFLTFLLFFSILIHINAKQLSSDEIKLINNTLDARLASQCFNTPEESVSSIQAFSKKLKQSENYKTISEECSIILDNMLIQEEYGYIYEKEQKSPLLEPMIVAQYNRVKKYMSDNADAEFSSWFYATAGDVLSSCLQFLPLSTAMKEGMDVKKYYEKAVSLAPDTAMFYLNLAMWHYYAPGIAGGSKKKAQELIRTAETKAVLPYEQFFSLELLSQFMFEADQKDTSSVLLDKASTLNPNSRTIAFVQKLNQHGWSIMYYTMNRDKLDPKLK